MHLYYFQQTGYETLQLSVDPLFSLSWDFVWAAYFYMKKVLGQYPHKTYSNHAMHILMPH